MPAASHKVTFVAAIRTTLVDNSPLLASSAPPLRVTTRARRRARLRTTSTDPGDPHVERPVHITAVHTLRLKLRESRRAGPSGPHGAVLRVAGRPPERRALAVLAQPRQRPAPGVCRAQ